MKKKELRVLSYNIHKGFSFNAKFVLHQIKEAVHLVNADVVFLQEVLGHHDGHRARIPQWPHQSQFEFLADSLWPHWAYGKNAIYSDGHHGNVILSRFPIISWENIDVSTSRFERRGLLHGTIDVPGLENPVHLVCVHLSLLEAARQRQLKKLCESLAPVVEKKTPVILAGDFNDWAEKATVILEKNLALNEVYRSTHGEHARTFPSWFPFFRLDRIYCRGFEVRDIQCLTGSPWKSLSDHAALCADLMVR